MDYVKTYGNLIKKTMDGHPVAARRMVNFGLAEESFRIGHFPPKEMPQALKVLDSQSLANVNAALKNPQSSCWTNIFAPVELMQCFDLRCVSMECLASFLSGFKIEDALVNEAEAEGIAPTLCSYHKSFIGGTGSSILPDARLYVTTSLACDGNINTFRYVGERRGVPGAGDDGGGGGANTAPRRGSGTGLKLKYTPRRAPGPDGETVMEVSMEREVRVGDKLRALELLSKYLGLAAAPDGEGEEAATGVIVLPEVEEGA